MVILYKGIQEGKEVYELTCEDIFVVTKFNPNYCKDLDTKKSLIIDSMLSHIRKNIDIQLPS